MSEGEKEKSPLSELVQKMADSGIMGKINRSKVINDEFKDYPIEVAKVTKRGATLKDTNPLTGIKIGDFASVRPCGDSNPEGKTFFGYFIGDIPYRTGVIYDPQDKELMIAGDTNPAFFLPDLGEVVFGMGSFWGKMEKPEDLKQISDADINSLWYVKALQALEAKENDEKHDRQG